MSEVTRVHRKEWSGVFFAGLQTFWINLVASLALWRAEKMPLTFRGVLAPFENQTSISTSSPTGISLPR